MIKITLILLLFATTAALAAPHQRIDSLGMSPKGQFVAVEEYGYEPQNHSYYVIIKIMNVWKQEYVGKPIQVRMPVGKSTYLADLRKHAKFMAEDVLKTYNIVTNPSKDLQ